MYTVGGTNSSPILEAQNKLTALLHCTVNICVLVNFQTRKEEKGAGDDENDDEDG